MPIGPHSGNRNRPAYSGQPRFRFPKQIIQLFAPRKPLEFKPPPRKPRLRPMTGLAHFKSRLAELTASASQSASASSPKLKLTPDDSTKDVKTEEGDKAPFETPAQRRLRTKRENQEKVRHIVKKARRSWDPKAEQPALANESEKNTEEQKPEEKTDSEEKQKKTKEPYSTIFVWNIPKTSIELTLQDEFEAFGPVRNLVMPTDHHGVPRGYAFIEYEDERDADVAVRQANGMRFEGRRLKVDVERGRTVKGWYPNRLDGQFNSCAPRRR